MRRIVTSAILCALLAACGGGGGTTAPSVLPKPVTQSTLHFVLKVPPAAKQMHSRVHRMYVSPGTLGVGINFAMAPASFTSGQLQTPNVAFDLSTCGSGCTSNADGSKTYTLSAPIPGSTNPYTIEIVTWDTAPGGTASNPTFSGSPLSQQIVSSQSVTPGSNGATLSISLDAIPAAISFQPLAAQTHVVADSAGWQIIGNAPMQFAYNVLDADGYVIASSDPGAPTLTTSDPSGDGQFQIAYSGTSNIYNVQALSAGYGPTPLLFTATPPSGSGINVFSNSITFTPVQEVWSSTTAGGPPAGLLGYAMFPPSKEPSTNAIDYVPISTTSYNIRQPAFDSSGDIFLNNFGNAGPPPGIYKLTQSGFSQPPAFVSPTSPVIGVGSASQFDSLAIDSNQNIVTIASSGGLGYGGVSAYSLSGSFIANRNSSGSDSIAYLSDVTVAPPIVNGGVNKDQIFAAGYFGIAVLSAAPSLSVLAPTVNPVNGSLQGIIFDANGYLWTHDGGSLYVYQVTGTAAAPVLTQVATLPSAGVFTSGMGRTAQDTIWIPEGSTVPYATEWKMACTPTCTISQVGGTFSTAATNFSMVVVP